MISEAKEYAARQIFFVSKIGRRKKKGKKMQPWFQIRFSRLFMKTNENYTFGGDNLFILILKETEVRKLFSVFLASLKIFAVTPL